MPYPEKDLKAYFQSSASPESFAKKLNDPQRAIWVIEDTTIDEFVAYAVVGPCHVDDIPHPNVCSNQDGLINRLYVRRDRQNHGFGQQLMSVMVPWLEEHHPTRPIWLAVLPKNFKAQKFYVHYDFSIVGEFDYPIGEWKEPNFIMKRQAKTS